jgi:chromosome segregation ATPase
MKRIGNVLLVSVSMLGLFPETAPAQLAAKGSGAAKPEATGGAVTGTKTDDIQNSIKKLQDSIKRATDRLEGAGKSSTEQTKALDDIMQTVEASLKEVSAGGGLYGSLERRISETEAQAKAYHEKSISPTLSLKAQTRYRALEAEIVGLSKSLYQAKMGLIAQKTDLEKTLQEVKENRELVVDLLRVNDLKEANNTVLDVIKSMSALNQSFSALLDNVTTVAPAEKTQ